MKRIVVSMLIVLSMALPVMAQDEVPTLEVATLAPVVTETAAPTVEPVPTETPEPEPSPIDESAIPEQVWVILGAAILGIVSVAFAGIVAAYKGLPAPVQAILLSGLKSGADEFEKKAKTTESPIDDVVAAEFKKRIELLESALKANGIAAPPVG